MKTTVRQRVVFRWLLAALAAGTCTFLLDVTFSLQQRYVRFFMLVLLWIIYTVSLNKYRERHHQVRRVVSWLDLIGTLGILAYALVSTDIIAAMHWPSRPAFGALFFASVFLALAIGIEVNARIVRLKNESGEPPSNG